MADTGLTVWAAGFWPDDFWAAGFWSSDDTPPPVVPEQPTGGGYAFHNEYDAYEQRRNARRRAEKRRREEEAEIKDKVDREIAQLLRVQEEKDAEREDLARIQALADQYAGQGSRLGLPKRVSTAILKAHEERSRNALEQVMREIERMREEEEFALIAALLLDD